MKDHEIVNLLATELLSTTPEHRVARMTQMIGNIVRAYGDWPGRTTQSDDVLKPWLTGLMVDAWQRMEAMRPSSGLSAGHA